MRPPSRRRSLLAAPAVAYAVLIFAASSLPGSQVPATGVPNGDKLLHAAEYGVFGLLLLLPVRDLGRRGSLVALAVGGVFAATDELHQAFVPGRSADVLDFAIDVVGLLLAVAVFALWSRWRTAAKTP